MNYQKIIIIGAPRSGTNMLRDILTSFDGVATWPCDEINYIWRYGNRGFRSDKLPVEKATLKIQKYIRKKFDKVAIDYQSDFVVEKTCANSLRVPFIDKILPDAKFIYICRDGIDATGSAKERWTAGLDVPYLMAKIRYVPPLDLPYYAVRYLWARLCRLFSNEKRLAFWGPALENMPVILKKYTLIETCALQWQQCVDSADSAFSSMSSEKVIRLSYEDFVMRPTEELSKILCFLGKEVKLSEIDKAVKNVSTKSLGKGRASLCKDNVRMLEQLVGDTLKRHGYL